MENKSCTACWLFHIFSAILDRKSVEMGLNVQSNVLNRAKSTTIHKFIQRILVNKHVIGRECV